MIEEESGFFVSPKVEVTDNLASLKLIHSSEWGFCDIYRIDRGGRFRALKCLKEEYRGNPFYENLLRKEFEIGYLISHPNICEYYGFTRVEGLGNCIELEWVDGRSLEEVLTKENPSKMLTDSILDGICDALSYIHSKQIIHRDLKPSNILVTYMGNNVRLIDFGFSDSDSFSVLKSPAGTLKYTAPEALKEGRADIRSDIYSLGVILSRMKGRYRSVERRCCKENSSERYSSAYEVKKALHKKNPLHAILLFIILSVLVVAGAYLYNNGRRKAPAVVETQSDTTVVAASHKDSTLVPSDVKPQTNIENKANPASAPKKAAPSTTKKDSSSKKTVDVNVIDEIFQHATDLFE